MRACEIATGSVASLLFIAQQHIVIKMDKLENKTTMYVHVKQINNNKRNTLWVY